MTFSFKKTSIRLSLAVAAGLAAAVSSHAQSATATISAVAAGNSFAYTITLKNTGSVALNSFWYGWTIVGNNLPSDPSSAQNSLGWANDLTANSIEWVNGSGTALAPGNSATFTFVSTSSPSAITKSPSGESVAYVGGIDFSQAKLGDSTQVFSPTLVNPPTPTVSITNPVNGATFTNPASVTIQASASVSSGTVTNVAFFAGATLLGSASTAPFNFTATNLAAGSYSLTAVATAAAQSATSAVVSISVVAPFPPSNSPPVILEQPLSQTVLENTNVMFSVTASNATSYQWESNMVEITGQTNDSLTLSNVVAGDSATYRVIVSNATNSVISSNAVLLVLTIPLPVITTQPHSTNAVTNTTVTFSVTASNAAFYQWESNLVSFAGATNASLTLSNVVPAEAGDYQVIISNASGSVTSSIAVFFVGSPVSFTLEPASVTVSAGTPVTLQTLATGLPAPQYQWFLNNLNLPGQTNANLVLEAATANVAGTYSIIASNAFGPQTSSNAVLTVTPLTQTTKEKLAVKINPANSGAVAPNFNGESLIVTHTYTVQAVARKGLAFADWSGIVQSDAPSLTFVMPSVSGATLTANFIPSPFASNGVAGAYAGLFWDTNHPSNETSGWFSATLADNGVMDGLVKIAGVSTTFATTLHADGSATLELPRHNLSSLVLTLQVDLTGSETLNGTVSDTNNSFHAQLTACRAGFSASHSATDYAGYYTWVMPGGADNVPAGYSYGIATITAAGGVHLTLFLSDGTATTASGTLSTNGQVPLYLSLYGGKGSLLSWLSFTNTSSVLSTNGAYWLKNPVTKGSYPDGFTLTNLVLWMGAYTAEAKGLNALDATAVSVQLSAADLTNSITDVIVLNSSGIGRSSTTIAVNVSDKTGLFSGSFKDSISGKTVPFKGAILHSLPAGYGFFTAGGGLSGAVVIEPQ